MFAATGLSGCFLADPDISGVDVLNKTDHKLWLDEEPTDSHGTRVSAESHAWAKVATDACTTHRLEAHTRSGRVIATLNQNWCPGQDWIITAQGEFVLYSTP